MTYNFDFRGHISPFGPKITPENWSFKAKNNAQTTSKHNSKPAFKNSKKRFFWPQKMVKSRVSILANVSIGELVRFFCIYHSVLNVKKWQGWGGDRASNICLNLIIFSD